MKNSNQNSDAGFGLFLVPILIFILLSLSLIIKYILNNYPEKVIFGPLYFIFVSIKVFVLEVPLANFTFNILFLIGILFYASMVIPKIRTIYDGLPVLIPFFQMCFLMLIASVFGLEFLNSWADNQMLSKAGAVLSAIITYVLIRLLMSYWYYKFPISSMITREDKLNNQTVSAVASSANTLMLPNGRMHKNLVLFALIFLFFLFIASCTNIPTPLDSNKLMKEQFSREPAAGTKLFNKEEHNGIQARDFNISGLTRGVSTRMLIWDFNSEDHDIVQILVDGKIIQDSIVLTNTPVAFTVPVPGVITIKGIQDQGGGLAYAVKFPQTRFTCFNIVAVNGVNTYTLLPKL
ncbi:hypothetical protein [Paenibacillus sp. FSL H7-0331]|uniref:hypothetical protein n=1 Tax=Paenibacillus sp. FSL H7-0331 TaxID=1920421 RepID=UPI00096CA858|nr:hypothetical protein [Paenibacillus sp. FSL H7-0331]OMF11585.1 hypothetical protein BK127_24105 [Paenibacillus sp. FSL H7-0331]